MAYFPFMMEIEGKKCLVVGGGNAAHKKAELMLEFGAKVVVISPQICNQIIKLSETSTQLMLQQRKFSEADLELADLVIVATNDETLNTQISLLCKEEKILVNVVDVKEECSFIFPALIREKNITIAVSTGGYSPAIAAHLKKRIEDNIPKYYADMAETLGDFREYIKKKVKDPDSRKALYYELIEHGDHNRGTITQTDLDCLIEKLQDR